MSGRTPSARLASTSLNWPWRATVAMHSPERRENVDEDTVSISVVTPWQAASSEERSFRSPSTSPTPALLGFPTLAGTLEALTRPRTGLPTGPSIVHASQ